MRELYNAAKTFADAVVTQEYGATDEEKSVIGTKICHQLIRKIKEDLTIACQDESAGDFRHQVDHSMVTDDDDDDDITAGIYGHSVRTRLYFTSESHLHGLMNALLNTNLSDEDCPITPEARNIYSQTPELCYLSHVVIRLFEDMNKEQTDLSRFRIEIMFSPGADRDPFSSRSVMNRFTNDAHPTVKVATPFPLMVRTTNVLQFNNLLKKVLAKGMLPVIHEPNMSSSELPLHAMIKQFTSFHSTSARNFCNFWKRGRFESDHSAPCSYPASPSSSRLPSFQEQNAKEHDKIIAPYSKRSAVAKKCMTVYTSLLLSVAIIVAAALVHHLWPYFRLDLMTRV